jgi:hypothetical protein
MSQYSRFSFVADSPPAVNALSAMVVHTEIYRIIYHRENKQEYKNKERTIQRYVYNYKPKTLPLTGRQDLTTLHLAWLLVLPRMMLPQLEFRSLPMQQSSLLRSF